MSWLSSIFHPPTPPDPTKTAAAQSQLNKDTAITQYGLNATNQVTPYGNLSYSQNGTWADGTPKFTATQSLSPEQQSLYNQNLAAQGKMAGMENTQIDKLGGTLGTPWNPNQDVANKLSGMQHQFLDPEWNTREEQMRSRLANQGITAGSDAYNTENRQFGDQRSRAYDQMYLDSYKTGLDQSLQERNQPFNELSAFRSGTQIQNPNFTNTPQTNLSTPDLAGMTYQNYQGQLGYQNAAMGGVFGLGAAALGAGGQALGGWMKQPAAAAAAGSDIRIKRDIVKIGNFTDTIGLYRFKYKWSDQDFVGVIAQEVLPTRPDAVVRTDDGYLAVKYGILGAPFMTWEEWVRSHGTPLAQAA